MPRSSSRTSWLECRASGIGELLREASPHTRIHAAVKTQMNAGGLKGALLTRAVNTKLDNWRQTGQVTHSVYDALVFRKVSSKYTDTSRCMPIPDP